MSSTCDYPPLSARQKQILRGLMLGDGYLDIENGAIVTRMYNKTFLEWVENELGWIAKSVSLYETNVDVAKNIQSGFGFNTESDDVFDYYGLRTMAHPWIMETFESWYDDGFITFPPNTEFSPIAIKIWYVSDGNLSFHGNSRGRVIITSQNERDQPHVGERILKKGDIRASHSSEKFRVAAQDIEKFFKYIGDPLPGFRHKWSWIDRYAYDMLCEKRDELHRTQTE